MNLEQLIALILGPEGETDEARATRLAALTDTDLTTHLGALRAGYAQARGALPDDPTDEVLDALEVVQQAIAVGEGEVTRRSGLAAQQRTEAEQAADARRQRLAAMDEAVGDPDGGGEGAGGDAPPAGGDAGAGAGDGDPGGEGGAGGGPAGGDAPPAGGNPNALPGTPDGGGQQASGRPSLGALATLNPAPPPAPDRFEVTAYAGGLRNLVAGARMVPMDHVTEIQGLHRSMLVPEPSGRRHYLGSMQLRESQKLVACGNPADGTPDVEKAVRQTYEARMELAAELAKGTPFRKLLKASGGSCAVAMPDYAMTFVGDRGTSFVDQLPGVIEKRPMTFYKWFEVDFNSANPWVAGMGTVTASQDLAGYGGTHPISGEVTAIPDGGAAFKGCVHIDCPAPVTLELSANYKCVTYGRFQAISLPEYVRVFDTSTALWFDVYRDTWAINKFKAAAGAGHTITIEADSHNAVRELRAVLLRLLAHYRSARKSDSISLNVAAPNWLKYQLAAGMALEMDLTGNKIGMTPDQVWGLLATEGLDMMGYSASAGPTSSGASTILPLPTNSLADWPDEVRLLVWPQGGVFRQTAGEVSFGLVETLYATNDYGTFEEQFEQLGFRTNDLWIIDVKLCANGVQAGTIVTTCGNQPGDTNEMQSVAMGSASAGDFLLTFDGEVTAAIAFNASAATVRDRLEALSNIQPGDVAVAKVGTTYFIQFTGQYAGTDVPVLVANSGGLTGGPAVVSTVQVGG